MTDQVGIPPAADTSPAPPGRHKLHMRDWRCDGCGRLLFRAQLPNGGAIFEIQCRCAKCGRMNVINEPDPPTQKEGVYQDGE